jgi:hypothetical protein
METNMGSMSPDRNILNPNLKMWGGGGVDISQPEYFEPTSVLTVETNVVNVSRQ